MEVVISVPASCLNEGYKSFALRKPRSKAIDPGGVGTEAGQQTGAGGIAQRRLTVGIEEDRAPRRETVHVRGFGLGMPSQTPFPVIEVVDRDEQDVRFLGRRTGEDRQEEEAEKQAVHGNESDGVGKARNHGTGRALTAACWKAARMSDPSLLGSPRRWIRRTKAALRRGSSQA